MISGYDLVLREGQGGRKDRTAGGLIMGRAAAAVAFGDFLQMERLRPVTLGFAMRG
jgi:hypothetical protein